MASTEPGGEPVIKMDVSRLRPADATKVVAARIWRTREGQKIVITSDRDLSFLLSILAEHGFPYEKPREEDGVLTLRAVRK